MTRRTVRFLLCAVLALPPLTAQCQQPRVKVGVIMGFTGPLAPIAVEMRRGMEIALEEGANVEILFEDDRGMDNKAAVAAFTKLAAVDRTPIILSWVNSTMPAIAPAAERHRVPVVEFWDSNNAMLTLGAYVLCSGASTEKSNGRMAVFVRRSAGVRRIAIIAANDPWSELAAGSFADEFRRLGGEIAYEARVNPDEQDLKGTILKARAAAAEGIFAPLFFNSLYNTIRQARELGFAGKIFTADAFVESDIDILKDAAEGVFSLQTVVDAPRFLSSYSRKFGPPKSAVQLGYAALAYDGVKIVDHAIALLRREGKEASGPALRDALRPMRYEGITGTAVLGGESQKVEAIVQVKGRKFELVR